MPSMTLTRRPIWLAFVITPLLTPLAFFLAYATYYVGMGYNRPGLSWLGSLAFMYLFGTPLGYLVMGALGLPWVIILTRWQKLTVGYVCAGACIIGMITFSAFAALIKGNNQFALNDVIQRLVTGLIIGLLSGLIFCAIAGVSARHRK